MHIGGTNTMDERDYPATRTMEASDAQQNWGDVINSVVQHKTRVLVKEGGAPVVAIVSAEDLERLNRMDERRQQFLAAMDASQAAFAGIPDEELEREIDNAIRQVRAQKRGATELATSA